MLELSLRVHAISAGNHHTCALLEDDSVRCWGSNTSGQLGLGDTEVRGDAPGEIDERLDLGPVEQVVALADASCALLRDGDVKCWGQAQLGRLGYEDEEDRGDDVGEMGSALPAVALGSTTAVERLYARGSFVCASFVDRAVKCWGFNSRGQLAVGDASSRGDQADEMGDALPTANVGGVIETLSVGGDLACAIVAAEIKCWGQNGWGGLGQGHTDALGDDPGEVGAGLPVVPVAFEVSRVVSGMLGTVCAIARSDVYCWGRNDSGLLGRGDTESIGDAPGEMTALRAVSL